MSCGFVVMTWCRQVWCPRHTVSPSTRLRVGAIAWSNSDVTGNIPSFRHRQKYRDLCWWTGITHSGITETHSGNTAGIQVCMGRYWQCVMSEARCTAILHLSGLCWRSVAEREEHWTVELCQPGGSMWRLLQQVHSHTYEVTDWPRPPPQFNSTHSETLGAVFLSVFQSPGRGDILPLWWIWIRSGSEVAPGDLHLHCAVV